MLDVTLKKRRGDIVLDVAFTCRRPSIMVLFGRSGSGKTTIVQMLAGLVEPDEGVIRCGRDVLYDSGRRISLPPEKRGAGIVFQERRLFSHISVRQNLLFGHRFGGRPLKEGAFDKVVALLGLERLLHRRPNTLSGGEGQRVAIGRALLACTSFLLMDEPLASLDQERKDDLLRHIDDIPGNFGIPVIYVTHSRRELNGLADDVLFLGRERGTPAAKTAPLYPGGDVPTGRVRSATY